jgi:hypothetical protein
MYYSVDLFFNLELLSSLKNFRTALHKGFGNLVVCSKGEHEGGYTLLPQ